jgi:hypothetical protein
MAIINVAKRHRCTESLSATWLPHSAIVMIMLLPMNNQNLIP